MLWPVALHLTLPIAIASSVVLSFLNVPHTSGALHVVLLGILLVVSIVHVLHAVLPFAPAPGMPTVMFAVVLSVRLPVLQSLLPMPLQLLIGALCNSAPWMLPVHTVVPFFGLMRFQPNLDGLFQSVV